MATSTPKPNWQGLLPVARELERWVSVRSSASIDARETWSEIQERQNRTHAELMQKLARLPGCTITISPHGLKTTLLLAGVEVLSHEGPVRACREWINKVRNEPLRSLRPTS